MAALSIAAGPQYRPRAATNELKEIVEDAMEELFRVWDDRFRESYGPLPTRVRKLLERFLRCGDFHFGFLRLKCTNADCPEKTELLVPHSCKVRGLCPSCGQKRALLWAERMVEEVLPIVAYRQLVFTIPRNLRPSFLRDRSLYGDLCRVAYASTRDFLRERAPRGFPKFRRAVPAMVIVPQSFGDLLIPHPHAHAVCSLGLFTHDGTFLPMEDLDFSGVENIFRERLLELMIRRGKILPETADAMRSWEHSGFNIGWQERKLEPDDRAGLEGLLSYIERAPVSLKRLTYRRNDGMVHYQGTKFHPRLGIDHQLLPPVEFLAHLVHHVLLRFEISGRCYGAISTTSRRKLGWLRDPPVHEPPPQLLSASALPGALTPPSPRLVSSGGTSPLAPTLSPQEEGSEFVRSRRRGWAKLIAKVWLDDPSLCASCQKPMKIISAISSPEQDDVIERILRHMKLWDPPWLRQRKVRGPAPSTGPPQLRDRESTIDPVIDEELYLVDPPSQDDPST